MTEDQSDLATDAGGTESPPTCRNCGCALIGSYCHCCGQKGEVHRSIGAWWHDFLHSVLHLDGKFWRTLPMLALRPGELTRRYIAGERAKFISPLALFLFTVFLMFAVFSVAGPGLGGLQTDESLEAGLREERAKLSALETEARVGSDPAARARLERQIAETRSDIARLEKIRDGGITAAISTDSGEEGDALFKAVVEKLRHNPQLLIYKLQANAYKFSWALIPISVPFLWILFLHRRHYRREFGAYDHLVFVTYSIAFMSFALIAFVLLSKLGFVGDLLGAAALLVPPLHIYRQLRGAYLLSPSSAVWRALVLVVFANVALGLFAALLLMLGVVS